MIFILLWFCAGRKDLLPGGSSPSLLASSHLRYPVGLRVRPRSARDAAKRYLYILFGAMALATVKTAAHDHFAVGEYHCAVRGITI